MEDHNTIMRGEVIARLEALDRRIVDMDTVRHREVTTAMNALDRRLDSMGEHLTHRAVSREQLDALRDRVIDVRVQAAVSAALVSILMSAAAMAVARWFP